MSQISAVAAGSEQPAPNAPQASGFRADVSAAVDSLNAASYFGADREVTYSFDRLTHQPVVRVLDTQTKEVINQWPPEYALKLASGKTNDATGDS